MRQRETLLVKFVYKCNTNVIVYIYNLYYIQYINDKYIVESFLQTPGTHCREL